MVDALHCCLGRSQARVILPAGAWPAAASRGQIEQARQMMYHEGFPGDRGEEFKAEKQRIEDEINGNRRSNRPR